MLLPKEKVKASYRNPKILVLYSTPKLGKTTLLSQLENNLIVDLEDGTKYLDALKINANNMAEFIEVGKALAAGHDYKYLSLDTITKFESFCEEEATKKYKKTLIGKHFEGNSVLTLPMGAGYGLLREEMSLWLDKIYQLAPHIILVGHLKDKFITDKKGQEVAAKDLDLTGKLKNIVCANADAIGYLFRKDGKVWVSFQSSDEITCGARPEHLKGQTFEFDWNRIYID